MKIKNLRSKGIGLLMIGLTTVGSAQVPLAGFSISPNPVCSGAGHVVQITDLSTNSPTSWSYTLVPGGLGPNPPVISTVQNPTVTYNQAGTYTITLIATNSSGSSVPFTQTIQVLASPNAQIIPGNQNTCVGGNPITLNIFAGGPGNGANTYSWSTGATTASITVTPAVTTTYSCIVTATNGCSVERTATVTVGTPTLTIASVPASICPGSSSTLTATGQGPGPSTYTWSTGANTRTISTNVAGMYTATYTNNNGCSGTFSYNLGTSTTLSLTALSNPSVICAGSIAQLFVSGASSYTWSTGSMAPTTTVNPTSNTTYTVNGTLGSCSGVTTLMLNVSVSPTITISSSSPSVCSGSSVTLNASGATTYTWTQIGGNSPTISVSPNVNTTYTVRGSNPGCNPRTASISISVLPSPVISVNSSSAIVCAGEIVALAASGANTYVWSNGGVSGVIIITPSITASYTVTGTNLNNCSTSAVITQSVNACTGIDDLKTQNTLFELFPNPNNGDFTLRSDVNMDLRIINETGQLVKTIFLNEANSRSMSVSGLANGIYFIVGENVISTVKQKIVVLWN